MTVEVQDPFNTYIAAPGATVFPYTFKIVSAADLIATIDDVVIDLGIDYSLSGVGSNDGGDMALLVPLTGGQEVLLKRQMTFERETDYQQNGDFISSTVNNDFDRIWLALQQFAQDLKRSIKVAFTETTDQTIPVSPAARANKALVFDESGNVTASLDDYNDQATAAAASAAAAAAAQSASAANAAQTNADRIAADASSAAAAASAASINPSDLLHRSGVETATGKKTFSGGADVPDQAAGDNTAAAANTKFVTAAIVAPSSAEVKLRTNTSKRLSPASLQDILVLSASIATTSGTAWDFTGLPSWAKRITFNVSGFSTNGSSNPTLRIGSSAGIEITLYQGSVSTIVGAVSVSTAPTTGFDLIAGGAAAVVMHGSIVLNLLNPATNLWTCSGVIGRSDAAGACMVGGSKALAGVLDRLRLTTQNGTDTGDAGIVNIIVEG